MISADHIIETKSGCIVTVQIDSNKTEDKPMLMTMLMELYEEQHFVDAENLKERR